MQYFCRGGGPSSKRQTARMRLMSEPQQSRGWRAQSADSWATAPLTSFLEAEAQNEVKNEAQDEGTGWLSQSSYWQFPPDTSAPPVLVISHSCPPLPEPWRETLQSCLSRQEAWSAGLSPLLSLQQIQPSLCFLVTSGGMELNLCFCFVTKICSVVSLPPCEWVS